MITKRKFHYCACGNHAFANTTKGFVVLVDPADVRLVRKVNWNAFRRTSNLVYATGKIDSVHWYMHRWLQPELPYRKQTDHINGNGMDNRRSNLRIVSYRENQLNRHTLVTSLAN